MVTATTISLIAAIASAFAYSTDIIFPKVALDNMPMYIFLFILCCIYMVMAVILIAWKGTSIFTYLKTSSNKSYIRIAILGILVGTLAADILMWAAIKYSARGDLPLTSSLIHIGPTLLSVLIVAYIYKIGLKWQSILGIVLVVSGAGLLMLYTEHTQRRSYN